VEDSACAQAKPPDLVYGFPMPALIRERLIFPTPIEDTGLSAFPALTLAIALTYVLGDFFRPFLPRPLGWMLDIALCFVLYKITHHYLSKLRE
jgi:hypothetical protein